VTKYGLTLPRCSNGQEYPRRVGLREWNGPGRSSPAVVRPTLLLTILSPCQVRCHEYEVLNTLSGHEAMKVAYGAELRLS